MPTVVLKAPHTHAGISHPAGSRLDLSQSDADWLIQQQVAELRPNAASSGVNPKPATDSAAPSHS
ncbi:hypothetical protein [Chitinibacter sp. GC72]|uniref:DUF7210 family protein n=1 Tax=Chitinibacter sp. GC72 TaxID=1526917 RepID=UPI0012F89FD6|nr:hypothetical protein [Chitinibacter sp. GC72]